MLNSATFVIVLAVQSILFSATILLASFALKSGLRMRTGPLIIAGMAVLIGISIAILLPVPGWFSFKAENRLANTAPPVVIDAEESSAIQPELKEDRFDPIPNDPTPNDPTPNDPTPNDPVPNDSVPTRLFVDDVVEYFEQAQFTPVSVPEQEKAERGISWPVLIACCVLALFAFGLVRFCFAIFSVYQIKRSSEPLNDSIATESLAIIQAKLGSKHAIELRQSTECNAALTIGFRNPVVILSNNWKSWGQDQLQASLGHEVAHIVHRDFLHRVIAQMTSVIHFFNPLVHVLCHQLKMEQEINADNVASQLVGGRTKYLKILAEMALDHNCPKSRLAPMFLPTRKTFFRRIEMLRSSKRPYLNSRVVSMASICLAFVIGIGIGGLRLPQNPLAAAIDGEITKSSAGLISNGSSETQNHPLQTQTLQTDADLAYVNQNSESVVVLRPRQILNHPLVVRLDKELADSRGPNDSPSRPVPAISDFRESFDKFLEQTHKIKLADVDQIKIAGSFLGTNGPPSFSIVVTTESDGWWKGKSVAEISKRLMAKDAQEYRGKTIYRRTGGGPPSGFKFWFVADDKTLVAANDTAAVRAAIQAKDSAIDSDWGKAWSKFSKQAASFYVSSELIANMERQIESGPVDTMLASVLSPLWERTDFVVAGIEMADTISIEGIMQSDSTKGAKELADSIAGLVVLGKAFLKGSSKSSALEIKKVFEMGIEGLSNTQIKIQDDTVSFAMTAPGNLERQLGVISPMIVSVRQSADRTASANNLRAIAIAMHNYHDLKKSFPAAVMTSESGKKYSWRIALLPFLGHQKLYDAYRFDEDWDSAHNSAVTERMPHVFRHPNTNADSRFSNYYVVTGDDTAFPGQKSVDLESISDGTSNTICCVESKREVHWAKPEDIPFETNEITESLGGFSKGGFNVSFCDASVQFISSSTENETFLSMLTATGGELVSRSSLNRNSMPRDGQDRKIRDRNENNAPVDHLK